MAADASLCFASWPLTYNPTPFRNLAIDARHGPWWLCPWSNELRRHLPWGLVGPRLCSGVPETVSRRKWPRHWGWAVDLAERANEQAGPLEVLRKISTEAPRQANTRESATCQGRYQGLGAVSWSAFSDG